MKTSLGVGGLVADNRGAFNIVEFEFIKFYLKF